MDFRRYQGTSILSVGNPTQADRIGTVVPGTFQSPEATELMMGTSARWIARGLLAASALLGGAALAGCGSSSPAGDATAGRALFSSQGCSHCHKLDNRDFIGPNLVGLFGSKVALADGSTVVADRPYLVESIVSPAAKKVAGTSAVMPPKTLTAQQVDDLVAFIVSLRKG
jgi:cytochrome c2